MKLNCGSSWESKKSHLENWHRWFAWYPVRVADFDCRWLETVERQGRNHCFGLDNYWEWKYRVPATPMEG